MNSLEVYKGAHQIKFILYPDTIPFEKLNLKVVEWLNFNVKVFILPRVAELFIHKEKQRGCPLFKNFGLR